MPGQPCGDKIMKRTLFFMLLFLVMVSLASATLWGRKASATTTTTSYTLTTTRATHITFYNSGTSDVAVGINTSTNALFSAVTNGTAALVPAGQPLTVDLSPSVGSAQLNKITNVVIRAENGTQTVYITAY
jgi:hypothetical protein